MIRPIQKGNKEKASFKEGNVITFVERGQAGNEKRGA